MDAEGFRRDLTQWFLKEGKDYPWRRTNDPWAILVSEIMLQQTTVQTIERRFLPWLEQFPTPISLAEASEAEILRSWEGLGYYRRVRNLQKAAQGIVVHHGGQVPSSFAELRALPGIGDYTAAAVASFAFHQAEPLVDANVARIFARLFDDETPVDSPTGVKILRARAELLLDKTQPHAYNSGLMELGQTYCKKIPQCLLCPVQKYCTTTRATDLPAKVGKPDIVMLTEHALFYLHEGKLLLARPKDQRRVGFLRLPLRKEGDADLREATPVATHRYGITHHRITQHIVRPVHAPRIREDESLVPLNELDSLPLASPDRKILKKILCSSNDALE